MKNRIFRALIGLRVPQMLSRLRPGHAAVVMYHGFTDRRDHPGIENGEDLHLHVDTFREHLRYLKQNHQVIALDTLVAHCRAGTPLPDRAVVLTMDDGYRSNYRLAHPLLEEFECPATIFVATEFVDDRQYQWTDRLEYAVNHAAVAALEGARQGVPEVAMRGDYLLRAKARLKELPQEGRAEAVDALERELGHSLRDAAEVPEIYQPLDWVEIRAMLDRGLVSIGSHTRSHYIVSRCTDEALREEIAGAKALIEERTHRPCPLFAYPNGARGDFDARSRALVEEVGHSCAITTIEGAVRARSDPFELRRRSWFGQSPDEFPMALCGISGWLASLRG